MKISADSLVRTLVERGDWVEAKTLADIYGVTPRTIRNYVRKANDVHPGIIESSRDGYRVASPVAAEQAVGNATEGSVMDRRANKLVRWLLRSQEPQSMYELAERLHVSDSTFQAVLREVRALVEPYGLSIGRSRDLVSLEGDEGDKRRFINRMLSLTENMDLAALTNDAVLEGGYDAQELRDVTTTALDAHGLSYNDYGLNNIVMHLAIMASRLGESQDMPASVASETLRDTPETLASEDLCRRVGERLDTRVGNADVHYLSLIVEANTKRRAAAAIMTESESPLLDDRDLYIARDAADQVSKVYCLEPFSDEFVRQLAAHIHALLHRATLGTFIYNPLAKEVRAEYPLVHDMAVVMADVVMRRGHIHMTEDEIAFFTIHLGGYFQNNAPEQGRVSCAVLYLNYHTMQETMLRRLERVFGDEVEIVAVESVSAYVPGSLRCDILLAPLAVEVPAGCIRIVTGPILTSDGERRMRRAIDRVVAQKRSEAVSDAVRRFLREDLFRIDFYPGNRDETIAAIVSDCLDKGLVDEGYYDEVLQREELSPTVFNNLVAIPHTLEPSARHSFLYLVINERPIPWGSGQSANIILLLGISDHDRTSFTDLYSDFLAILSSPENATELMKSTSYADFVARLKPLLWNRRYGG